MKTIGIAILAVMIIVLALAIGGGLFTLLSYGVGMVITRITGLDPLPATITSMAGIFLFGILVERTFNLFLSMPKDFSENDEFDDEFDFDDEEDEFDFDQDPEVSDKEMDEIFAGIPRWRRPLKTQDFSNVDPDDRCPCGSGRKYKNCHGRKTKTAK